MQKNKIFKYSATLCSEVENINIKVLGWWNRKHEMAKALHNIY